MATGEFNRQEVQSPLGNTTDLRAGVGLQSTVQVGGVMQAQGMNVAPTSTKVMDSIAEWGGASIRAEATKEWNKSMLEGQMAYQQGQAFDQMDTGGDKWKAEGYHVMEAQTLSATLLAAQQNEIQNTAYSMNPDEYRAQYVQRLDSIIAGKDPRVQELVRKQMAAQMPSLVAAHTSANMTYNLQRTAESGIAAIGALSQDTTASDALLAIASPTADSPLAGLPMDKRREVVAQGVAYAFQSDNPAAYIKLKAAGMLDQLTPAQQASVEAARQSYMNKQRATWDAGKAQEFDDFYQKLENGQFSTPIEAATEFANLNGRYGVEITAEEGYNAMTAARTGIGVRQQTTANNLQTALIAGDYDAAAQMIAPALVNMESGGSYTIHGPTLPNGDYAIGKYQIMASNVPSWTKQWLGYSMTAAEFQASPEAQDKVYNGQFGSYLKKYGTAEDAISMWHSGRPLSVAVAAGAHDINMSTKDYVSRIMGNLTGTPTADQRLQTSEAALKTATMTANQEAYSQMAPQVNAVDQLFISGKIPQQDWQTQREALYTQYHQQRTDAVVNQEIGITNGVMAEAQKTAKTAADQLVVAQTSDAMNTATNKFTSVYNNPDATLTDKQAAIKQYTTDRNQIMVGSGLPMTLSENTSFNDKMSGMWDKAVADDRVQTEKMAAVQRAANGGSLGTDATVDAKTRTKWWDQQVAAAQADAKKAVAANPKLTAADETAMVQQKVVQMMASSGYIPEDTKAQYSAALGGQVLDKNGNVTPEASSTVHDYLAMKLLNPRVANLMLDGPSKAIADQVLDMAGNNPNSIDRAFQQRETGTVMVPGAKTPTEIRTDPGVVSAIQSSVSKYFGDDKWFNLWGWRDPQAYRDITHDSGMQHAFQLEVSRVTADNYAESGGKGRPENLVKAAIGEVASRTVVMGGSPIVAPAGVDVVASTFGAGMAQFGMNQTDVKEMTSDPSSVDNAVRNWIVEKAGQPNSGIAPEDVAMWVNTPTDANGSNNFLTRFSTNVDKLYYGIADNTANYLNSGELQRQQLDYSPLNITPDGRNAVVVLQPADGRGTLRIVVPLAEAGAMYIQRKKSLTTP